MSKIATLTKYNAPVLSKRRFQRLLEIENSGNNDIQLDDIKITFSGPEYGWLDVKIEIGSQVFEYSISDLFQPFKEMNQWFVDILRHETHSGVFQFDCEGTYVQFFCDYLGYWEHQTTYSDIALFTICHDCEDDSLVMGVFAIEDFVSAFYYGLLDYFEANKGMFIRFWRDVESDEKSITALEGDMTSATIEERIPRNLRTIQTEKIEIPVTEAEAYRMLDEKLGTEGMKKILLNTKADYVENSHMDLGLWIRNHWVYGQGSKDQETVQRCEKCIMMLLDKKRKTKKPIAYFDADDASRDFIGRYYDHVKAYMEKNGYELLHHPKDAKSPTMEPTVIQTFRGLNKDASAYITGLKRACDLLGENYDFKGARLLEFRVAEEPGTFSLRLLAQSAIKPKDKYVVDWNVSGCNIFRIADEVIRDRIIESMVLKIHSRFPKTIRIDFNDYLIMLQPQHVNLILTKWKE